MPFDLTPITTTADPVLQALDICNAPKAKIAAKRAALIDAVETARLPSYGADLETWRALAIELAASLPKPPAPKPDPVTDGEWDEYTDAQRKGRGRLYHPGRFARFRFADGELITVNLTHHHKKDTPDWHKASFQAVAFYKARRCRNFLQLVDGSWDDPADAYAYACAVPEIVEGTDITRDVTCSPSMANAATAARREGPRYLSELANLAAEYGGDWKAAWAHVRRRMARADHPDQAHLIDYPYAWAA